MRGWGKKSKIGHSDLADEFRILSLELRAGLTREQSLRNLINRTEVEEIRSLVALLIQTDRFGTSIGQSLRVHSDSMRMNRRLRAEELAAKLPVKLMLPPHHVCVPCDWYRDHGARGHPSDGKSVPGDERWWIEILNTSTRFRRDEGILKKG